MAVKIIKYDIENWPSARLIGRKYEDSGHWGEWWENDWFTILEKQQSLPMNGNSYIGAMRVVNGEFEYWIGMFFPADSEVPEGFTYVDIEPLSYAVFYLYGNEHNSELFGVEPHNRCLEMLKEQGVKRYEDNWCFERYNCPRYTTPDEQGKVILDYGISIESYLQ